MAAETITEQEHNAELSEGTPVLLKGVDANDNTIVCTPESIMSFKELKYGESTPKTGNFFGPGIIGTYSSDGQDGAGFQFSVVDDMDDNPRFLVRVWLNSYGKWSPWKTVAFLNE